MLYSLTCEKSPSPELKTVQKCQELNPSIETNNGITSGENQVNSEVTAKIEESV